ncbi:MAG: hypothetical protein DRJ42_22685 [Deltaproteobacteria bacterium]|nr:MAG: hypothetical protein DRJ42_22685 [Deltaproteobacteria bacterium]
MVSMVGKTPQQYEMAQNLPEVGLRTGVRVPRWSLLIPFLLSIVACDCSNSLGTGPEAAPCTSSADCDRGFCVDGLCEVADGGGEACDDPDGDGYGLGCTRGPDCEEYNAVQTGAEICDGLDNDCDGVADNGVRSPCGDCISYCEVGGVGTGGSAGSDGFDVAVDESEGVSVDEDGALVLDSREVDTHFIWIANTAQGTVSKVDTRTYVEVARYVTGPAGTSNDPSRTSVNLFGDAYIGNRGGRTVTKISALGADCPDTNADGVVTTSTGPDDILAWGMDDCMLWNTSLPDGGIIRAVAAQDVEGLDFTFDSFVWIGGWEGIAWKLDGDDGSIVVRTESPTNNYGFALDGNGQLWVSGRGHYALGRIDTTRCLDTASCSAPYCDATGDTCVKQRIPMPGGENPYGITVDLEQRVWTANHGSSNVVRYDHYAAAGASRWASANVGQNCHGIAADADGWVWAACWDSGIRRILGSDPSVSQFVAGTGGFSSKGMAIDFDGKVWTINRSHNSAIVVTPGPTIDAATVETGVANRIVGPYTYSDMTGQQLRLATNPRGYYRRTFEGCAEDATTTGTEWEDLRWVADVPPGTRLIWRVRTAANRADLAALDWVLVAEVPSATSPASIRTALETAGVTPGRWLEVEVQMHSERSSMTEVITPRLFNIEGTHLCPPSIE